MIQNMSIPTQTTDLNNFGWIKFWLFIQKKTISGSGNSFLLFPDPEIVFLTISGSGNSFFRLFPDPEIVLNKWIYFYQNNRFEQLWLYEIQHIITSDRYWIKFMMIQFVILNIRLDIPGYLFHMFVSGSWHCLKLLIEIIFKTFLTIV